MPESRSYGKFQYREKCHRGSFAKVNLAKNFKRGHSQKFIPKISQFFGLAKVPFAKFSSFKVVGSGLSHQSCLYIQGFWGSRFLNG